MSMKIAVLGAGMLLGASVEVSHAVTVSTGDTLKITFDMAGVAYDPNSPGTALFFTSNFDLTESFSWAFYDTNGTREISPVTARIGPLPNGEATPFIWAASSSILSNLVFELTNIVGSFDVYNPVYYNALPQSGGDATISVAGTFSLTPSTVPIPAALHLLATGLGALGIIGWRRKRQAAAAA